MNLKMRIKENLTKKTDYWLKQQAEFALTQKPKLYFFSKFVLLSGIMLLRVFNLAEEILQEDHKTFDIIELGGIPLFFLLEFGLFFLVRSIKKLKKFTDLLFGLFQLAYLEFITALSMPLSISPKNNSIFMLQQEILFICTHTIIFINSSPVKPGLLLYVSATFAFRFSPWLPQLYYISWAIMAFSITASCFFILFSKDIDTGNERKTPGSFSKLENIPHGVAILNKDKQVIFMNSIFKGILNLTDEKDALQKILKMKRFEAYPEETQQLLLQEIQVQMDIESKTKVEETKKKIENKDDQNLTIDSGAEKEHGLKASKTLLKKNQKRNDMLKNILRKGSETIQIATQGSTENANLLMPISTTSRAQDFVAPGLKVLHPKPSIQVDLSGDSPDTVEFSINTALSSLGDEVTPELKRKFTLQKVAKSVVNGLWVRKASIHFNKRKRYYVIIFILLEETSHNIDTNLNANNSHKIRAVNRNAKGELKIFEITLSSMLNEQKDAIFVYLSDITSEMKAHELQKAGQYKDRLLSFVSHEFRTPLNCSILSLNMLKPLLSTDLYANYLAPALNSSLMLLNLVNDILDYSQMQAKKLKVVICPWHLKNLVTEVLAMMEMQASARNIKLELDWDARIPTIYYTDGNRLKQILINLFSNALKFTIQGSITLKGSYIDQKICKIEVIDTGVGISKENLEKLFKEFGKIQDKKNLNPQGVGLGLVISKSLSEELGYNKQGLQVRSELGVGTTFEFLLESKEQVSQGKDFEATDLESSDEDKVGPHLFMQNVHSGQNKLLVPSKFIKTPLVKQTSQRSNNKSRTAGPKKVQNYANDPFTFNFAHVYSKTNFSNMVAVITNVSAFPPAAGLYGYKNRRLTHRMKLGLQRHLSTGTRNDVDNDSDFSEEFGKMLKKLNRMCKCKKILVVDDNAFNLAAIKMLLKSFDIESIGVTDGQLAIQEVLDNEGHNPNCRNFALILMDIEMPRLNGFEASKMLRKMMVNREIPYIPIIGVTGHDPLEKRVDCLLSGMNDMVSKPVNPKIIQELIYKWITSS